MKDLLATLARFVMVFLMKVRDLALKYLPKRLAFPIVAGVMFLALMVKTCV